MASKINLNLNDNGLRASKLLIDGCGYLTKQIILQKAIKGVITNIDEFLAETNVRNKTSFLKTKNIIKGSQYDILYPSNGNPTNLDEWDITLLTLILNNCFTLTSTEKDTVQDIRRLRNTLYGHTSKVEMADAEFEKKWADISSTLTTHSSLLTDPNRIAYIKDMIIRISKETLSADRTIHTLKEWYEWGIEVETRMEEMMEDQRNLFSEAEAKHTDRHRDTSERLDNMADEVSTILKIIKPSKESDEMEPGRKYEMCEQCEYQGLENLATSYCKDCDEPERMCTACASQHTIPKVFRNHIINKDITTFDSFMKNKEASEKDTQLKDIPGRPRADEVKADSVRLSWNKPNDFDDRDRYQIRYKETSAERWTTHPVEIDIDCTTLVDLKADTEFEFQVRTVHIDGESKYSYISEVVRTPKTPGCRLLDSAKIVKKGDPSPSLHSVPMSEIESCRDEKAKCRKFEIDKGGHACNYQSPEKTIMLVGATGTGKSTLVDGIMNYVLGVNWDDTFRFTAIDLEPEERDKQHNEAVSQTEWITCYSINPYNGSRLDYRLTVIDTPGFGDTRGIERDSQIVEQISQLFSANDIKGVSCIDAICFLIKAPDARLTATQKYIFYSIMSLFGRDIEDNICTLVTFADGEEPPVLASLTEAKLPFGRHLKFNNSALFTKNTKSDNCSLSRIFWDMGCKSFHTFFNHLNTLETKSLFLTKQVLEERNRLEVTVQNLSPKVQEGLSKISQIKKEQMIFENRKTDIEQNKNFTYEIMVTHTTQSKLPPGHNTTCCRHCHTTCHKNCQIENDANKRGCSAIGLSGECTQCENKCHWSEHSNLPFIYEYRQVSETRTYDEMKEKYEKATGEKMTHKYVLEKMTAELADLLQNIEGLVAVVKECNTRLSEIALRPNPLSMVEHIDLMIGAEKLEKNSGYFERIQALKEIRQKAGIQDHAKSVSKKAKKAMQVFYCSTETFLKSKTKNIFNK